MKTNIYVQFMTILQSQFESLEEKDEGTLYFCTDTHRIYVGAEKYTFGHPIQLEPDTDYGTTLPASPATNQLFFQTVGSNFVLDNVYPVGAVYMSMNSTNPGTLFGGTWEQVQGKFLLGASSSYPSGSSGGEEQHTLTAAELPSHNHAVLENGNTSYVYPSSRVNTGSGTYSLVLNSTVNSNVTPISSSTGRILAGEGVETRGSAHNNMPPYLSVYIWYRTA